MRRFVATLLLVAILVAGGTMLGACSKGALVGSNISDKYHDPSCVWAEEMSRDREVWFADAAEAEAAGYVPCETCCPPE